MKRAELVKFSVVLVLALVFIGCIASMIEWKPQERVKPFLPKSSVVHPTIDIDGNAELDTFCNDSTDGLSWSTAHVIENLEIFTGKPAAGGISIINTNRHLIIRNCTIINPFGGMTGIGLEVCTNIKIINCTVKGYGDGIAFGFSNALSIENCIVYNNSGYGIYIGADCSYINISNTIVNENGKGIILDAKGAAGEIHPCHHNIISNNTVIENGGYGIRLYFGANSNEVCYNCFRDNELGDILDEGLNNDIHDNFECPNTNGGTTAGIPGYHLIVLITLISCTIVILTYVNIKKREI